MLFWQKFKIKTKHNLSFLHDGLNCIVSNSLHLVLSSIIPTMRKSKAMAISSRNIYDTSGLKFLY